MTSKANELVRTRLLALVGQGRIRPTDVLARLEEEEFEYQQIQDAILELLNERRIQLSSDRYLSPSQDAAA
jgi:hypothetical protein